MLARIRGDSTRLESWTPGLDFVYKKRIRRVFMRDSRSFLRVVMLNYEHGLYSQHWTTNRVLFARTTEQRLNSLALSGQDLTVYVQKPR